MRRGSCQSSPPLGNSQGIWEAHFCSLGTGFKKPSMWQTDPSSPSPCYSHLGSSHTVTCPVTSQLCHTGEDTACICLGSLSLTARKGAPGLPALPTPTLPISDHGPHPAQTPVTVRTVAVSHSCLLCSPPALVLNLN